MSIDVELSARVVDVTGKQIAKKLSGIDKTELNQYLYSHMLELVQKDWKWYLAETKSQCMEIM